MIIPVILSGGVGTRLWPLSRNEFPKQFMPMLGGKESLLQSTVKRFSSHKNFEKPIIIANEKHRFVVAAQLQDIDVKPMHIILEPCARSTAPAAAVASFLTKDKNHDPILLVVPSDHYIKNLDSFLDKVENSYSHAESNMITFGVLPERPETGYGYIKRIPEYADKGFSLVEKFVEKPDRETAELFMCDGNYLWNSGIFMFKASIYLSEIEKFNFQIYDNCRLAADNAIHDDDFVRINSDHFSKSPSDSIDYAVFEKTKKAVVCQINCGWSDVGSWSSLKEVRDQDVDNNVCIGDVITNKTSGCYVHSTSRLVATIGIENIAIVETKDAVLATSIDHVQDVKKIVDMLRDKGRKEVSSHCKVFRPWGYYESVDVGERYQVKRITVYPEQILSLQKHYHRSEHWVVVKGTAIVTKNDQRHILKEDESTYIPLGTVHRLENPGKVNLEIIEIQTGSYLGEDDIVRIDDVYGRK